ncbi:MAG: PPC domain-containing DNA-binding protein [Candidatus Neomarinimicrobiota bacterium]|nr:PPC domain-containing DNA-binding protein [Candidatus Neomarinimicrobiota bacterium]
MKVEHSGQNFLVYIQIDEPVMETLTSVCKNNGIMNGQISGIGAVKEIEMGAYDLDSKSYLRKQYPDNHELISFQGNITLKDGNPFIHAHITIGNHDLHTRGGHLFEMKVAVVGEFIIRNIESNVHREFDKNIGLAVWCLENT